jgi:beta-lactamase class A
VGLVQRDLGQDVPARSGDDGNAAGDEQVSACRGAPALLAALALAASCAAPASAWHAELRALAARDDGRIVAIAYRDLARGDAASAHGDVVLHAASTMKVPVMFELFARAEQGTLDLDAVVTLRNEFRSIVDGSPYALEPGDDSDPELYHRLGAPASIRELLTRMITHSSNLATNTLIALAEPARVQARCAGLGARRTRILRGVEDSKAFARGLNNVTTADDLAALLCALARGEVASAPACAQMRAILAAQQDDELIPAGLPPGTRIEHKTGQITGHRHDAAIVTDEMGTYVLVVLTKGFADAVEAAGVVAAVARRVHERRQATASAGVGIR